MKAQIVSFHCVLKDLLGQVLSSSYNQDVINQLEGDQKLQGLVAGLQNVKEGEKRHFTVPAVDAYGPYNPDLVMSIQRSELVNGEKVRIGSEVLTQIKGSEKPQAFRVTQMKGDTLVLDGNHPLAGQDLVFDIEVVSVRDARREDYEEASFVATEQIIH